jgi:hypothetical protein
VELPGCDFAPQLGDTDRLLGELDKFLSDVAAGGEWQAEPDRVLATVLFTDIVDRTTHAPSSATAPGGNFSTAITMRSAASWDASGQRGGHRG